MTERNINFQSIEALEGVKRMMAKREAQGGVVYGYHGTSVSNARQIEEGGFINNRCVEGDYGVYFWDDEKETNAIDNAKDKARELDEVGYAVIKAKLKKSRPDILHGRPQWIANAKDIEILEVKYY